MRKLISYTFITAIIAMIFAVGSCTNPLIDTKLGEEGEGTFALQVAVPNYDLHFSQEMTTKVVAPQSEVIAVYFDELATMPEAYPQFEYELYNDWDTSNASNGFFYTLYEKPIDVPAGTYEQVRVELLTDWMSSGGTVITSGVATNVTVSPWPADPAQVHITLTPPAEMFTPITVGSTLTGQAVDYEGMEFFSFDATQYTGYNVTITPIAGEPDAYLFNEQGLRTGLEIGHDIIYTADPEGIQWPGSTKTMAVYKEELAQTYYIGVYGWQDSATFDITVTENTNATYRPPPETEPSPTEVELLVSDGIAALDNPDGWPDYDLALDKFAQAHALDPYYGPAFAGYNALYTMSMMVDPDIVHTARDILGMTDYATSMTELFNGEWLQIHTTSGGWDQLMPRITDQHLKDGAVDGNPDGFIDPYERLLAFMDWFIHHSDGFGDVANVVLAKLGDRLDYAIQQIMAMDPAMAMEFTWDMFFDDFERDVVEYEPGGVGYYSDTISYNWPVDEHGHPVPIILGKAELLAMASALKMVETFVNIGKAYEYNLIDPATGENVLVDYWSTFNPVDGTADATTPSYTADVTPFETDFLNPRGDALLYIEDARFSFLDGLDVLQNAIFEMQSDRTGGFVISPSSPVPGIGGVDWQYTFDILEFESIAIDKARFSVNNPGTPFIVPTYFDDAAGIDFGYYAYGNWPTTIESGTSPDINEPGDSVGVNLGIFFSNPIAFLLELDPTTGEPMWYEFTPYSPHFSVVTSADVDPAVDGTVYARITDLTMGGVIPYQDLQYVPVDDPNTRARLDSFGWDDWGSGDPTNDDDGIWQPGEHIYWAEMVAAVEGAIDIFSQDIDVLYPSGDPVSFYDITGAYDLTDGDILAVVNVASTDLVALRDALNASPNFEIYYEPLLFLDDISLFVPAPSILAWHSLTAPGTTGLDSVGDPVESTGSAWWFGLNQIYNMGG